VIIPIYSDAQARETALPSPAEGETVLLHDNDFWLGHGTVPVVKLMSYVDGEWIDISIWAAPADVTAAMGPMPEGATLPGYEPPPAPWDGEPPPPLPRPDTGLDVPASG
jgi:hypothetical protein